MTVVTPIVYQESREPDPLLQKREGSGELRIQAVSAGNAVSWMTLTRFRTLEIPVME